jgi:hypothetical protein
MPQAREGRAAPWRAGEGASCGAAQQQQLLLLLQGLGAAAG